MTDENLDFQTFEWKTGKEAYNIKVFILQIVIGSFINLSTDKL